LDETKIDETCQSWDITEEFNVKLTLEAQLALVQLHNQNVMSNRMDGCCVVLNGMIN